MTEKKVFDHECPMCRHRFSNKKPDPKVCGDKRPPRDVLCQREKDHKANHTAAIFWEDSQER